MTRLFPTNTILFSLRKWTEKGSADSIKDPIYEMLFSFMQGDSFSY